MPHLRLIQFRQQDDRIGVGLLRDERVAVLNADATSGTYGLAMRAIAENVSVQELVESCRTSSELEFGQLLAEGRLLPPISHVDPAHCMVSGTGLTHLASAAGRDAMHSATTESESDSIRMYRRGLDGGKPANGVVGAEPEWFYKGDGSIVAVPEAPLVAPHFALDGGEEPELVGIYIVDATGQPRRIGFTFGNEFSDHVLEKRNYLSLAHSKLRMCSLAPEIIVGELPGSMSGEVRIRRDGQTLWSAEFKTGENNMCHSLANLEHHHFKYRQFRRPGDVHIHFFGTATLSFADGVQTESGDWFEVNLPPFSKALRNQLQFAEDEGTITVTPL